MDFDPRGYDSRADDRFDRGGRGNSNRNLDRDDDLRLPDRHPRDRDDDAREPGRGPGDDSRQSTAGEHNRDSYRLWPERDRDWRERDVDPRDVFTRDVNLPRGLEREIVRDRDREYTLRGSESRTLATVGAFRVVSSRDLRDHDDRLADPRSGDLRRLREQGLVETVRIPGSRDHAVALTKEGRSLLESHRDRDREGSQTFYAGVKRERELEHDVQVYRRTNVRPSVFTSAARVSITSFSTTSSSVTTSSGCTSGIASATTTTATRIAPRLKSASGRWNTTCRTSTTSLISRTSALSTRNPTAGGNTTTSR